ncbi:MAG: UvrD-helicase domain-containing protein, partial [Micromonosporaceae bacterium]
MPPRSWVADLHIHSRYSRACSRDLELDNLAWWAQRKGITLLGTGDFTHPAWYDHLREGLRPAEPGLFRLSPEREERVARRLPPNLHAPVRFLLSVEISTIYKRDGRTRKVHHLVYLPDLDAVARFNGRLGHGPGGLGGNLGSDGRPILGLDSRDLLEIVLETSPDGFLVPAHIWTPWFSALGSKSGFDTIAECYADLAGHIKAVETGLSSDPQMNWRVAELDRYQLVSNSDAHSPPALAREATLLHAELDYAAVRRALETGDGLTGTVEFFPEEGKYHADGHRACGVTVMPGEAVTPGGAVRPGQTAAEPGSDACPECGKPLTIGVLHRVAELADRPVDHTPPGRPTVTHLIQLHQVVGEVHRVGARSRSVQTKVDTLVAALGPELHVLTAAPLDEVARVGGDRLAEAIGRLRRGEVRRVPGYDGEYGVISLFGPGELDRSGEATLFELATPARTVPAVGAKPTGKARAGAEPAGANTAATATGATKSPARRRRQPARAPEPPLAPPPSPHEPWEPMLAGLEEVGTGLLDRLDSLQRVAASAPAGALLVVAGPGTGKTRALTHRIAYLCAELGVVPQRCLAITFTRRAAEELRSRLQELLAEAAEQVTVGTFHAVGLSILRENAAAAGL